MLLKWIYFRRGFSLFGAGLPVGQQRPPGSPPAGPQRPGGRAGAGDGDVFTEAEPDGGQQQKHPQGELSSVNKWLYGVIVLVYGETGDKHVLMFCRCDICAVEWG